MRPMKDSGVQWIGQIPSNWNYVKLKYFYEFEKGKNASLYTQEYLSKHEGEFPVYSGQTENNGIMGRVDKYDYDLDECLFTTTVGAKVMTPMILKGKFSLSQNCLIMKKKKICNNHFVYFLLFPLFDYSKSLIPAYMQPSLRIYDLNTYGFYIPNNDEQKQIADYLDKKCGEIDSVIKDIQTQIETLGNYKKSVVTEAVTKGLNPNVEFKDSKLKWIGAIPSNWISEKIKFNLKRHEFRNPGDKQILSVYREYGVIPKDSRNDNHNVTSEDTSNYKYVKPGLLVINKMKAWQGSMGISDYDGVVSPAYFIYKFNNNKLIGKYLHFLLRYCYRDEFRRISGGIREGQWDLNPLAFENTFIIIPPLGEQKEIVKYLDKKCAQIDEIIKDKQSLLETIEEYKKSLIYEYVTGKKEVK